MDEIDTFDVQLEYYLSYIGKTMTNEDLLKLYIADQAERNQLLQIKDKHEIRNSWIA